jgi:type II secretory pathway component PulM
MFRFTIRDVLWLTVVVGLVVAWWTSARNARMELEHAQSELRLIRDINLSLGSQVRKTARNVLPLRLATSAPSCVRHARSSAAVQSASS